jgi:hypothetical protein
MVGAAAGFNADSSDGNTFVGCYSGFNSTSGSDNCFVGMNAGHESRNGDLNTLVGRGSGENLNEGSNNTFLGAFSGSATERGEQNVFVGAAAGGAHIEGDENVFIGMEAAQWNESGNNNIMIGPRAGWNNPGDDNVIMGFEAGAHSQGSGNVFIGHGAGMHVVSSDVLVVDNAPSDSTESLIWGKFDQDILRLNNRVGIGRHPVNEALEVEGNAYKTDGNTSWDVTSDARVKTDIRTIESGLAQIMRLRPVTFRYTDEWRLANPGVKNKDYYHFVAQEFAEVFPESVHRGPETLEGEPENLLRMNSQPAQVVAIRAIQELAEQNREQQAIIDRLLDKVDALEQQLSTR